jgi:hypothetical protein
VYVIVILELGWQWLHDADGIWPWVYAGIVALKGFDEGLADAVAFRASDWREARNKVQRGCEIDGLGGGIGGAIISQPLDGKRGALNRRSAQSSIVSRIIPSEMPPPWVATQVMISRS